MHHEKIPHISAWGHFALPKVSYICAWSHLALPKKSIFNLGTSIASWSPAVSRFCSCSDLAAPKARFFHGRPIFPYCRSLWTKLYFWDDFRGSPRKCHHAWLRFWIYFTSFTCAIMMTAQNEHARGRREGEGQAQVVSGLVPIMSLLCWSSDDVAPAGLGIFGPLQIDMKQASYCTCKVAHAGKPCVPHSHGNIGHVALT